MKAMKTIRQLYIINWNNVYYKLIKKYNKYFNIVTYFNQLCSYNCTF